MKNLRTTISNRFDKLDDHWRSIPVKRQHRYMLLFFLGYVLLTAAVIIGIWYDVQNPKKEIHILPIENPIIKKPTS
jgi:hypothetical protein